MAHVVLFAIGSRGDVCPILALGEGLHDAGHSVRVVTHAEYADAAARMGLEPFRAPGPSPRELMGGEFGERLAVGGTNPARQAWAWLAVLRDQLGDILQASVRACEGADLVVGSVVAFGAEHAAERLGLPFASTGLQPLLATRALPSPVLPARDLGPLNRLSHRLVEQVLWQPLRRALNDARRRTLGLRPLPLSGPFLRADRRGVPRLFGFSSQLVPRPPDWPDWAHVCGEWTQRPASEPEAPAELERFLAAGAPPIYAGFGSMMVSDPPKLAATLLEAARASGDRVVLQAGWADLAPARVEPDVFALDEDVAHDWLFPRVSTVVCHGGAGTVHTALRAGRPVVVVPVLSDQPFWGHRVHAIGAGPPPLPLRRLTAARLRQGIELTRGEHVRGRAAVLGERLHGERGVETACALIERMLPSQQSSIGTRPETCLRPEAPASESRL